MDQEDRHRGQETHPTLIETVGKINMEPGKTVPVVQFQINYLARMLYN